MVQAGRIGALVRKWSPSGVRSAHRRAADRVPRRLYREPRGNVHSADQSHSGQPRFAVRRWRPACRVADDVALRRGDRASQLWADPVRTHQSRPLVSRQAHPRHVQPRRQAVRRDRQDLRRGRTAGRPRCVGSRADVDLLFDEFKYRAPGGRRRRARRDGPPTLFHAVPTGQLVTMAWRLMLSQTPKHNPADQPLPDWADT
jgi:hypothetical protein